MPQALFADLKGLETAVLHSVRQGEGSGRERLDRGWFGFGFAHYMLAASIEGLIFRPVTSSDRRCYPTEFPPTIGNYKYMFF